MSEQSSSVLVVGSVAVDWVITPTAEREQSVGGSATFFSMAASYFGSVRLVGVVGGDLEGPLVHDRGRRGAREPHVDVERAPGRDADREGRRGLELEAAGDGQPGDLERLYAVLVVDARGRDDVGRERGRVDDPAHHQAVLVRHSVRVLDGDLAGERARGAEEEGEGGEQHGSDGEHGASRGMNESGHG